MIDVEVIAEGLGFPEGPVVMDDGSVIVVETDAGRVTRCWNGRTEVVSTPGGGPNGLAVGPDGALYLCNNGGHGAPPAEPGRIERIDIATGRVERVFDACDGVPLSAPNDLMFDVDGQIWFTDLGRIYPDSKAFGGLYCAAPDGGAITRIKARGLSYNGVGISPDMTRVYVADTYSARVWAFERSCKAQEPQLLATIPGPVMVDSLAMAASGNVCVATLLQGGISTVTPQGQVSLTPCEDRLVTNIAFGGPDMSDAWMTYSARGAVVKARWAEPGMRLVYNA
jgi:gluconolactonase